MRRLAIVGFLLVAAIMVVLLLAAGAQQGHAKHPKELPAPPAGPAK